jgi:photosystem II stability/assembly factor-like uncharacterized protein
VAIRQTFNKAINFSNSRKKNIKMKRSNIFSKIIILLALASVVLTFQRCEVEFFDDDPAITGETSVVVGVVTDRQEQGLADVAVSAAGQKSYTGTDGTFLLANIPTGDKISLTFTLDGYATSHKVAEVVANDTAYVFASMSPWGKVTDIAVNQDNTVSFQNASVKLPANGIVDENGQAVTGNVKVSAAWFDPTDSTYAEVFPGDFVGEDLNGNEVAIESFGFITVEIKQGDKELDLAPGEKSEISIPVPSSILGNAPATIPLWYFDEVRGTWVEEGSASLQNGVYTGEVNHFTSWNCDAGMDASAQIKGKVTCYDGTPVADAKVKIIGLDYVNTTITKTGNDGKFNALSKPNSKARVYAQIIGPNGTTLIKSQSVIVNTGGIGSTVSTEDLQIDCGDTTSNSSYSFIYDVYSVDNYLAWSVGENGRIFYYNKYENSDLWILMPSTTTQALYAIDCPSYDNFWVVGSNGTVLQSTDFGQNWQAKLIGTDADLHDVKFIFKYGWIGGTTGKFFRTTDGGKTWNQVTTGTVQTIYDISFIDQNEGWLCGSSGGANGLIMHSVDGGQSWTQQNSLVQEDLKGIKFVTSLKGWAVGDNGTLIRTEDGGQTWTSQNAGTFEDLHAIDFVGLDGGNGFIVGDNGVVKKSEDGGESWINAWLTYYPQNSMYALDISSSGIAWFGGDEEIFWTGAYDPYPRPSGWIRRDAPGISEDIRDMIAITETDVWMVGDNGTVISTQDAGLNWDIHPGFQDALLCLEKTGSTMWIGSDMGSIWKSVDDGQNWSQLNSIPGGNSILKMVFTSALNGWSIVGINSDFDVDNVNRIYQTNDGGQSWKLVDNLPDGNSGGYTDLFFLDESTGWIIKTPYYSSYPAQIFKTTDGGNTWNAQTLPYSSSHSSGSFFTIDGTYLWLLGSDQTMHTAESNQIWYSKEVGVYGGKKMMYTDFNTGWCIGAGEKLYKSVNSGRNWEIHDLNTSGGSYEIYAVDMVNNDIGWAAGQNGYIFYTNTGGE